jgi:hypothetical protein
VSVPKESIWQDLRADCLGAIPPSSRVILTSPVNLAAWQRQGVYVVNSATKKGFELYVPADDFGSSLLADAEHMLDNAAEHQVSLWRHIHTPEWLSPAWLGVTVYYWSFYLALAITRLTGRTVWFVTREIAQNLRTLAPSTAAASGAGCYRMICGPPVSATERTLMLEKTDARIHDELWRLWFTDCSARLARSGPALATSNEARLFTAIVRSSQRLGNDWPSAFRNAINYRSGFAYAAVRRTPVLKSLGYLKEPATYDMPKVLDRFETAVARVRTTASISQEPQKVLELLVDLTFIIHAIAKELHAELLDRCRLDKRWRTSRLRFLKENRLISDEGSWPL